MKSAYKGGVVFISSIIMIETWLLYMKVCNKIVGVVSVLVTNSKVTSVSHV